MTQDATLAIDPPLSYRTPDAETGEPVYYGISLSGWLKIIAVTILMVATFRFNLLRLWLKTNPFTGELNWRHSVCVPLIGLYYLYVNRDDLLRAKVYTAWSGLGILLAGVLLFAYGIWPGQNDFIKDFGMVVTLFGAVALLCGWDVMKTAWFPIAFLVCAIPWPELVYSYVASPLQHLAASVAVGTLRMTGVEANNFGTKINMLGGNNQWRTLNVAEACAGLRSLMTFISVGGAVAFLSIRPLWQKAIITLSAIPIAIFCNVMRVSGQGLLDRYWSQEWSEGFAHQFAGIVMLIPGFLMILLVGWVLDKIFIEVADEEPAARRSIVKKAPVAATAADWALPTAKAPAAPVAAAAPARATPPAVAKTAAATTKPPAAKPQAAPAKPASAPVVTAKGPTPRPIATPAAPGVPRPAVTKPATAPASPKPAIPGVAKPTVAAAPAPQVKPTVASGTVKSAAVPQPVAAAAKPATVAPRPTASAVKAPAKAATKVATPPQQTTTEGA